jgi:hypothetical protein
MQNLLAMCGRIQDEVEKNLERTQLLEKEISNLRILHSIK